VNRSPAPKTSVRLPEDVTRWLQKKAEYHVTSMTAEIVRIVRGQIRAEMRQMDEARQASSGAAKH